MAPPASRVPFLGRNDFLCYLDTAGRRFAFLFDVDKTTADTQQLQGGTVRVRGGIISACHLLVGKGHGVGFISGRVEHRLLAATAGFFPIGSRHGRDLIFSDGSRMHVGPIVNVEREKEIARAFVASRRDLIYFEDKESFEIGFQNAEHVKGQVNAFMESVVRDRPDLTLLPLKMVYEVVGKDANKGEAVKAFLRHDPMFRGKLPVYFGDDVGDYPAGRAVQEMGGILVWVGDLRSATDAQADVYVLNPAAVERLLVTFNMCAC
ncbi:Trehalose-phosphate phosphatase [Gracilariopsis chorda]|uniref:Trehalose-phosphate phosphatase n=1 Tax=Gracilariopsis chorda TaxID=448386 RepID=A0A2V3IIR1_9FLOR|nr:Trehalose-phosphate phosphatase [Gracilariopsis chorda]|eukprot:PXF41949.1 Trehalose-phosphate phosphatase [Gracilariopsis chorda]